MGLVTLVFCVADPRALVAGRLLGRCPATRMSRLPDAQTQVRLTCPPPWRRRKPDATFRTTTVSGSYISHMNRSTASLIGWAHAIYLLHAVSLVTGVLGAATIVGAFLIGWPSIIAVVLNYIKQGEVAGTWLESHFRWQIRTFWFGLLWVSLCLLFVLFTLGIGLLIVWLPLGLVSLWFIYRVVRGWTALQANQPMPV